MEFVNFLRPVSNLEARTWFKRRPSDQIDRAFSLQLEPSGDNWKLQYLLGEGYANRSTSFLKLFPMHTFQKGAVLQSLLFELGIVKWQYIHAQMPQISSFGSAGVDQNISNKTLSIVILRNFNRNNVICFEDIDNLYWCKRKNWNRTVTSSMLIKDVDTLLILR